MGQGDRLTVAIAAPRQPSRLRGVLANVRAAGGLLPFAVYATLFLLVPTGAIVVGAFRTPTGQATLSNVKIAFRGVYRHGFETSIELSLIASILPAILGVLLARAIDASPEESVLRRVVVTASGVFANFGGVPLAFLFIATLGSTGLATGWLNHIGIHLNSDGFSLYTLTGVAVVYMYFQIPLMVLVSLPALQGLKPEWREASQNLGGGSYHYWRYVAAPALAPSVLGATLLLFGSAFSAYATADALTSGSIPLTSIQIGSFLNGNVIPGQENVGKALGLGMIVVIGILMGFYTLLQRRASRWSR
jgi:putative spermidine/putrescine transport system permease protein